MYYVAVGQAFTRLRAFALRRGRAVALAEADPCAIQGVERIVAVGDIHGAYDGFVRILRAARVIDSRDRWIGGATLLVQNGDVLDRGADSRKALDLLRRLERDAPRRKGRVLALIGNHEVMRMIGGSELRDMNPAELEAFRTPRSAEIRDVVRADWLERQREQAKASGAPFDEEALKAKFDMEVPLGLIEMTQAFSAQGEYGKWIRSHAAVARVNGILFLHGGISPEVASRGCEGINAAIRAEIAGNLEEVIKAPLQALSTSENGPLWYRGLAREDETAFAPSVDGILAAMQARAIVIGHTVTEDGRIRPRFGGRVVQIDTGMLTSVYKNGRPSALEIVGDRWNAIYEDGTTSLPSPASRATAPSAGA